jgi:integrase
MVPDGAPEGAWDFGYTQLMLTDAAIKRLQPKPAAYRVFEGGEVPGFGVKVEVSGKKSWFLRFQWAGKRRYLLLGHYPHIGTAAARDKARAALAKIDQGIDPAINPAAELGSLAGLLTAWLIHRNDAGGRRLADTERMIRANCGHLLAKPALEVTASDLRAALAKIHQRGSRTLANRLRAHLHALFRYGILHDHDPRTLHQSVRFGLSANPVDAIPRDPSAERAGERVLSWSEIRELWDTDSLSWPARHACRLLLVLGCRVNEICGAAWSEFDLEAGLWTLPAARSKNKREHLLPLPPLALSLLRELREIWPGDWLFPSRNSRTADKPWTITALSHAVRKGGYNWQGRDLRRTFKTLTGAIGIDKTIRDRIQNHAQTDVSSKHYDRHAYLPEKQRALDLWSRELSARLAGDNVIALQSKRQSADSGACGA